MKIEQEILQRARPDIDHGNAGRDRGQHQHGGEPMQDPGGARIAKLSGDHA